MPKLEILNCLRCGHSWPTKDKSKVRVCPKCKSAYYNTPKKERPIKQKKAGK